MSIAQTIQSSVEAMPAGQIFGYQDLPDYTQSPSNGGHQEKEFGTIRIKIVATRIPVQEKDIKLLQYLDALKDIKKISDSEINLSLEIMSGYIAKLSLPISLALSLNSTTTYKLKLNQSDWLIAKEWNIQ